MAVGISCKVKVALDRFGYEPKPSDAGLVKFKFTSAFDR